MRKRFIAAGVGAVLCLGAIVAAQDIPRFSFSSDKSVREQSGRRELIGNVVVTVNGVEVKADRAVIQNGEVTFEGNVRMTLPNRFSVSSQF